MRRLLIVLLALVVLLLQPSDAQRRRAGRRSAGGGAPPAKKGKDYYAILGVDRSADERQIKKAFRKLSVECTRAHAAASRSEWPRRRTRRAP